MFLFVKHRTTLSNTVRNAEEFHAIGESSISTPIIESDEGVAYDENTQALNTNNTNQVVS